MRVFTLPDGTILQGPEQFQIGNQKYPRGWLRTASASEISDIGVTFEDVPDPEPEPPTLLQLAEAALKESNAAAMFYFKTGRPFPPSWRNYDKDLRKVIEDETGELPIAPPFPVDEP